MDTLHFSIHFERFLEANGQLCQDLPAKLFPKPLTLDAYRVMRLIRCFDAKAIALQRTGQLGTYPSILGQEAIGTAIGHALSSSDIFSPYYRDIATQYLRGVSLKEILLYWGGSEQGSAYHNNAKDFPICVPIATQLGHAAGAAVAIKIRGDHTASLVTCGEGASSKGDFLETLNLAGAWQLPLVVVVNNNQWAISTPRRIQCGAETIAQKAIGAGIEGVVVDGNDYFAVYSQVDKALKKARTGKGATLIEAVSYRLGDHTTADDAKRYRDQTELDEAWLNEPIVRLQRYLKMNHHWSDQYEQALQKEIEEEVQQAVQAYLTTPVEEASSMLEYQFETIPESLQDQYAELRAMSLLKDEQPILEDKQANAPETNQRAGV